MKHICGIFNIYQNNYKYHYKVGINEKPKYHTDGTKFVFADEILITLAILNHHRRNH